MATSLEYAPTATVGNLVLTSAGGVATVTTRRSWRNVLLAAWPLAVTVIGLAAVGCTWAVFGRSQHGFDSVAPVSIGIAFVLLLTISSTLQGVVNACTPMKFEAGPDGLTISGRRLTDVYSVTFGRPLIADLRVERARLKNGVVRHHCLLMVLSDGSRQLLGRGTPVELSFMRRALGDALGLPEDAIGEADYPPAPPWWSPLRRQIGGTGVTVTLRPMRLPMDAAVVVCPSVVAGVAFGIWVWASHDEHGRRSAGMAASMIPAIGLLAWIALLLTYPLRRTVTVAVDQTGVGLSERSMIRPGREAWSIDRVVGIRAIDRPGGRRAGLTLLLNDGTTAALLDAGPARDVHRMADTLSAALGRRTRPSGIVAIELTEYHGTVDEIRLDGN